jgi:hypothetical protein
MTYTNTSTTAVPTASFRRSFLTLIMILLLSLAGAATAQRGEGVLNTAQPQGITPEQIIQRFAARETEFAKAREQYTFRQDATLQTLDGDTVDGEYRLVMDVTFDDQGKRRENVVFSPQPTLTRLTMDPEDFDDINHRYPFVITTEQLPFYQILYVGQQRLDEIDTYVFDLTPKTMEKGKRYFEGRIWVDNQDFEIVKSTGKPAFLKEKRLEGHLFPSFTTYREQVDGTYWFPTYTSSDEVLHFPGDKHNPPQDVRLRIKVKYTDYKKFGSKSRIIFAGEDIKNNPSTPAPPKK